MAQSRYNPAHFNLPYPITMKTTAFFTREHFAPYFDRRALTMLFLGFAAGLPGQLIFATLGLWLQEAGIERKMVTMFSWAGLGYSFKFVWSPLVDTLVLPYLTKSLGRRRSWLLASQIMMAASVCVMAFTDPSHSAASLTTMALAAVCLGFSSATQDIAIDAYRIESAPNDIALQSIISSTYVMGYRFGMILTGAGSLKLADWLGSTQQNYQYGAWQTTYIVMAIIIAACTLGTLWAKEPPVAAEQQNRFPTRDNVRLVLMFILSVLGLVFAYRFLGDVLPAGNKKAPLFTFLMESTRLMGSLAVAALVGWVSVQVGVVRKEVALKTWVEPVTDFFHRYGKRALLLLALIGLYRISDVVAGVISNVFYAELGFSKDDIANAVKTFGVIMSIMGGLLGGLLAQRFAVMKMMMLGAILAAASNLLFIVLANSGKDFAIFYFAVGIDNLAGGLASSIFIAFLSSLTNIRFSAVQYALFSSMMTLLPKVLGGYSGAIVDGIGYSGFFGFTAALGVPILGLIWWAERALFRKSS